MSSFLLTPVIPYCCLHTVQRNIGVWTTEANYRCEKVQKVQIWKYRSENVQKFFFLNLQTVTKIVSGKNILNVRKNFFLQNKSPGNFDDQSGQELLAIKKLLIQYVVVEQGGRWMRPIPSFKICAPFSKIKKE